jgi:hypothetical protein
MNLWLEWGNRVSALRGACSRTRTFMWMCVVLVGMSMREDNLGVTSFVRAVFLKPSCYKALLHLFHSDALKLDRLLSLWVRLTLRLFRPVMHEEYTVFVADGIKAPREGRKMPAVKSLHQESNNNSKPAYIMGHSFQAISLLVKGLAGQCFAVPILSRICEGVVFSNRNRRTLLDKLVGMFFEITTVARRPCLLVADAYYASRKVILPLLAAGHHLISRAKINSVAWTQAQQPEKRKRGKPRMYGEKIALKTMFDAVAFTPAPSPVYGEKDVTVEYLCLDLLWRPVGRLVRFVLIKHPTRGNIILLSTLLTMHPLDVLRLYSLRFKIESAFRQAVNTLGSYFYHFWMKDMKPISKGSGDQYMHRKSDDYRAAVRRKLKAYHAWAQLACIAQGLLMHLAINHHSAVWDKFRSWLRTMRPDIAPSELVVSIALRHSLPEYLFATQIPSDIALFILENADIGRLPDFSLAA